MTDITVPSDNRRSEDSPETIEYIKKLLDDGRITIETVLTFFNYACGAYKQSCLKSGKVDSKINIEFNYAARAFASFINKESSYIDKQLALLDAFQASRHIINDSLDIIVGEIERLIENSENISEYKGLSTYIPNYNQLYIKKEDIYNVITESRRKRGLFRYEAYLNIIKNEAYSEMIDFLEQIKKAIKSLEKDRVKEQARNRKNLFYILGTVFLALAIALFPDYFKELGVKIANFFK